MRTKERPDAGDPVAMYPRVSDVVVAAPVARPLNNGKVAVPTAPPAAVALTAENSITVAHKAKMLLQFFNVAALGHGMHGQVHMVFNNKEQANAFIKDADLRSERPGADRLKRVDESKYPGKFLVRVGQAQYDAKVAAAYPFPKSNAIESTLRDSTLIHKSELSGALYGLLGIDKTFLGFGEAPQVQFVFNTMAQAQKFIQLHDLRREGAGHAGEPKSVDARRYPGQFTVRLSAGGEAYKAVKQAYSLPEAKELEDAPPPPRGRF